MPARAVTLPTVDVGDVTVPCPSWCAGHEGAVPQYHVDITHYGPARELTFDSEGLFTVLFAQAPYSRLASRDIQVYVEQSGVARSFDAAGLDALAESLVEAAAELRATARELTLLLAEDEPGEQ